jgi:hypothetical protein
LTFADAEEIARLRGVAVRATTLSATREDLEAARVLRRERDFLHAEPGDGPAAVHAWCRFQMTRVKLLERTADEDDGRLARAVLARVHHLLEGPSPLDVNRRSMLLSDVGASLARQGRHDVAARVAERVAAEATSEPRRHTALFNAAARWNSAAFSLWCSGDAAGARVAILRSQQLLDETDRARAVHVPSGAVREVSTLMRTSERLRGRLNELTLLGPTPTLLDDLSALRHDVERLVTASERNPATGPRDLAMRYGRFGDVLIEIGAHLEATTASQAAAYGAAGVSFCRARLAFHGNPGDAPAASLVRHAEGHRLAGVRAACAALLRVGIEALRARCGADFPPVFLMTRRLATLDDGGGA